MTTDITKTTKNFNIYKNILENTLIKTDERNMNSLQVWHQSGGQTCIILIFLHNNAFIVSWL